MHLLPPHHRSPDITSLNTPTPKFREGAEKMPFQVSYNHIQRGTPSLPPPPPRDTALLSTNLTFLSF